MKFKNKKILVNESNYNELKNKSSKHYSFPGQCEPDTSTTLFWCGIGSSIGLACGIGLTYGLIQNSTMFIDIGQSCLIPASCVFAGIGIRYAIFGIASKLANYKNSKIKNIQQAVIEYEQKQLQQTL